MTILLDIKQLEKKYTDKQYALKNITFQVAKGEFLVIIGPSGAGKSTLIRSINQLVKPTGGNIYFNNEDVTAVTGAALRKLRSRIGMIFQHYNLISRTNVLKNVLHGRLGKVSALTSTFGLYSQEEREKAVALLKTVGLEEHLYKKTKELSGGQMQRVGICRALMQEPQLILADEPIASLDPKSSETVMSYLKKVTEEQQLTCIVNLHQVEIAKRYATRIIGIRAGEIVFDGRPEALTEEAIQHIYNQPAATQADNKDWPLVHGGEAIYG